MRTTQILPSTDLSPSSLVELPPCDDDKTSDLDSLDVDPFPLTLDSPALHPTVLRICTSHHMHPSQQIPSWSTNSVLSGQRLRSSLPTPCCPFCFTCSCNHTPPVALSSPFVLFVCVILTLPPAPQMQGCRMEIEICILRQNYSLTSRSHGRSTVVVSELLYRAIDSNDSNLNEESTFKDGTLWVPQQGLAVSWIPNIA